MAISCNTSGVPDQRKYMAVRYCEQSKAKRAKKPADTRSGGEIATDIIGKLTGGTNHERI